MQSCEVRSALSTRAVHRERSATVWTAGFRPLCAIELESYRTGEALMARKLRLVKGGAQKGALVYGMRLFAETPVASVEDAHVTLADGSSGRITMHLIEGSREQIRRQLMRSIDAFFELLDEQQ
jgi:hypothetical protein